MPSSSLIPRGLLDVWKPAKDLEYSHGLTGVDQDGNFRWVHVTIILFLAVLVPCLILCLINSVHRHVRHLSTLTNPSKQNFWKYPRTRWWPWMQRNIFTAPLWNKRHNRGFQISSAIDNGTLPGRWHAIILLVYISTNVAYCLALPWNRPEAASVSAALRGRSGTLAMLNLVPCILFALRNNPLIPLLGISYDDFNLFHRWSARIVIVEAIIHTLAWLVNAQSAGGWAAVNDALRQEESYTWGMVGTLAFFFILIQACSPLRHAFYETFLNIHRLLVILTLAGTYLHLERHGLPQLPWMWVIIAMWAAEWTVRLARIFYLNVSGRRITRIKVEAMPGEACRVTFDLVRPWTPRPGCHVHMYMPLLAWHSSHPFSVAWSPEDAVPVTEKEKTLSVLEGQDQPPTAHPTSKQISLICRARTGLTRKMYDRAAESPHETFYTWGFIEGPYGGHHSLDSYGTTVLVAGGVGITHQVMYIRHLIQGFHTGTTATQRILLVWTIPSSECLEWIRPWMDEILRQPGRKHCLRIKLFITRPKKKLENSVSTTVQMFPGRPNLKTILEEETRERVGAMAVTVCGSGAFSDEVRAATRVRMGDVSVDFVEEAFTY
ncbi:hypothetical protein P154DRAFT_57719 [Amniculicola lignicola CBS 123094]|uniref:FAD-binding FR-type domain-containing protein n=1 Tax=Amniculicola lignicola CBS 123094 TaxID=1392246 RepID=A0A6A5VXN0_9PLEO|nr:hypothetical protein P154DRAFT_57719 [Amniculicola lignicola CBS 123094]